MSITEWFIGGTGFAIGFLACYLVGVRPLVNQVLSMKKQGFVPQYEIEHRKEHDPSEGIREY